MRRIISLLLAALLALTLTAGALAEGALDAGIKGLEAGLGLPEDGVNEDAAVIGDATTDLQVVSVPEQGFTTKLPAGVEWYFHPDGGLTIEVGSGDYDPWISIFRAEDAPGSQFDYESFFNNVYTPQMQRDLGSDLLKVGNIVKNNIAGVEMMGVQYTYLREGTVRKNLCMFDLREDGFVNYEASYNEADQDRCLLVLAIAAVNYQPDAAGGSAPAPQDPAPAPQPGGATGLIQCPEMGFETEVDAAGTWEYVQGEGVHIYPAGADADTYAVIYCDPGRVEDAGAYLREAELPAYKAQFGDEFVSYTEYERYQLGDRKMPAMVFTYERDGRICELLRAVDERDGHSVIFSARYTRGEDGAVLTALDEAARNFRVVTGDSAPVPQQDPAPVPQLTTAPIPVPEGPSGMTVVTGANQGFTTLCKAEYSWKDTGDDGVYIYVEAPDSAPFASIYRDSEVVADGAAYIHNSETPAWQEIFGDGLVNYTEYESYTLGGRQLPAALYTHRSGGYLLDMLRVADARPDGLVVYTAHYIQGEGAAALAALDVAAANFTVTGSAPAPAPQATEAPAPQPTEAPAPAPRDTAGLSVASCPELGFSTLCAPSVRQLFKDKDGLYLYVEGEERIPYVLIWQSGDMIGDPAEYLHEQYTPYMQQEYGDDFVSFEEYERYEVGGRQLPAALYTYRVQNHTVNMLRVYDNTFGQTVSFTAKFLQENADATLAALDTAVANYQPDASYYG